MAQACKFAVERLGAPATLLKVSEGLFDKHSQACNMLFVTSDKVVQARDALVLELMGRSWEAWKRPNMGKEQRAEALQLVAALIYRLLGPELWDVTRPATSASRTTSGTTCFRTWTHTSSRLSGCTHRRAGRSCVRRRSPRCWSRATSAAWPRRCWAATLGREEADGGGDEGAAADPRRGPDGQVRPESCRGVPGTVLEASALRYGGRVSGKLSEHWHTSVPGAKEAYHNEGPGEARCAVHQEQGWQWP